jgi:acetyltransferase-like isoleucine patch superfamily enzyme
VFHKPRIPVRAILTEGMLPSTIQRRLYRRRGYSIARDVEFAPGVVIDADEVSIGAGTSFGFGTVIRGRSVRIGRRVDIGSFCFFEGRDLVVGDDTVIREQVFVGGPLFPDSLLEIGKRVRIFQTCFLNPSKPLRIGDETGVGGRSSIFTHGSWQSMLEGYPVAFEPVTIGRNVWLPWHVFILPGVEIGDNATIAAGSVVNRSVPGGTLAAGVPAKVLRGPEEWPRRLDEQEKWAMARSIFVQLFDYLTDLGVHIERHDEEWRLAASLTHQGTRARVALVRGGGEVRAEDDVVVGLCSLADLRSGPAVSCFGLIDRRKSGPRGSVAEEVEDFLARFGLRFAPADEA